MCQGRHISEMKPDTTLTPPNWKHQTIWTADNLDVMRGMNSASIDLIYLDPPFNSNANYAAPTGSQAAGATFKDTWGLNDIKLAWHGIIKHDYPALYLLLTATREAHSDSMMSYLIYMAIRITEMHRLLKNTGNLYLHCDSTASHYLKLLMDCVFGKANFRNEIVWHYRKWSNAPGFFQRNHDILLSYSKSDNPTFNPQYYLSDDKAQKLKKGYQINVAGGKRQLIYYDASKIGDVCPKRYDVLMDRTQAPIGVLMSDTWNDINILNSQAKERVGYPTQKPLKLLRRIIKASSREADRVLDPFCGCATTCIAAEMEGRKWVGIDLSSKAAELVQERMDKEGLFYQNLVHRTDIPKRTDKVIARCYNHPDNKRYLYGEQGGWCHGCEEHFKMQHLEIDHIIPRAKGGTDHISNLQLLCGSCNSIKGKESQEELIVRLTDKGYIKRHKAA